MDSPPTLTVQAWQARLGGNVRVLRQRQKLTQSELADRANVSTSAIKYLEAGKGSSLSTFIRVARVLGRTDWLAAFAPAQPTISPLAILREQRRTQEHAPKRVRRSERTDQSSPS